MISSSSSSSSSLVGEQEEETTTKTKTINDDSDDPSSDSWDELDSRPLPVWYDESKFGIFIHWSIFSVPGVGDGWFWSMWRSVHRPDLVDFINETERRNFNYIEYAYRFKAELWNPQYWATVFGKSGAQYVVLTSKHHEGYCMWNSTPSIPSTYNWNSVDIGPKRDIVDELTKAVKSTISPYTKRHLRMGLYHSLYEFYNPMYISDKKSNYQEQTFVNSKTIPELYDLVERYEPDYIWSDGNWEAPSQYWNAIEFLKWYMTNSTVASTGIWNDRWGNDTQCKHGAIYTCHDRYQPNKLQEHKWEDATTIDIRWGYNRNASYIRGDYQTTKQLVDTLISVVAYNGNLLLNVAPAGDGTISPIFVDRLLGMGDWLNVNGPAIYNTRPWIVCQNETSSSSSSSSNSKIKRTGSNNNSSSVSVYYTRTADTLYAHLLSWPTNGVLELSCPKATTNKTQIAMLGLDDKLKEEKEKQQHSKRRTRRTTTTTTSIQWKEKIMSATVLSSTTSSSNTTTTTSTSSNEGEGGKGKGGGMTITLPLLTPNIIPCQHAWVLAITGIDNLGPLM